MNEASVAADLHVIGRDAEVSEITRFLRKDLSGPTALFIEGDAGIGKTQVWRAALSIARSFGHVLLVTRVDRDELPLPFSGLADLLDSARSSGIQRLPDDHSQILMRAMSGAESIAEVDRRSIGGAVVSLLRGLSAHRQVVVAVDDVQWLDASSAEALEFSLRRLGVERIRVVATVRVADSDPLCKAIESALPAERSQRLRLGPLNLASVYQLLRTTLDLSVSRSLLRQIHEASGGNPFYALEFGRSIQRRGGTRGPRLLTLPDRLRDLVANRLAAASPDVRDLLRIVAFSSVATVSLLRKALPSADSILDEAIADGLIELEEERVRLTHPLFGAHVVETCGVVDQRALHARLAELVTDVDQRARHLALSAGGPDEHIAQALDEAALRAEMRGAPGAGAELCQLAVRLTPLTHPSGALSRKLAAARLFNESGETAQAEGILEAALDGVAAGNERAVLLFELGIVRTGLEGHAGAIELLRAARAEATAETLRGAIENKLAHSLRWADSPRAAEPHARAAVALAEKLGDTCLLAESLGFQTLIDFELGLGIDSAAFERAMRLEAVCGSRIAGPQRPRELYAMALYHTGRLSEARALLESSRDQSVRRDDISLAVTVYNLSAVELRAGRYDVAEAYADQALEIASQSGKTAHEAPFLIVKARVEAYLGLVDAATQHATEALAMEELMQQPIRVAFAQQILAFIDLSQQKFESARAHALKAEGFRSRVRAHDPTLFILVPDVIEALVAVGDLDPCLRLVDEFERDVVALGSPAALGWAARCRGLVTAAQGDLPGALAALEKARGYHEGCELPFELGRTLLALGRIQRRLGQKRAARDTLTAAEATFQRLGASLWRKQAHVEVGRIGGRGVAADGSLSATERSIADLVAAGRTNQEVAKALALSPRTVQWNLSKIYKKLGVRSRTELAATASDLKH